MLTSCSESVPAQVVAGHVSFSPPGAAERAASPDGGRHDRLWVTNFAGNNVAAYPMSGGKPVVAISQTNPAAVAFGNFGRVFVATAGAQGVVKIYGTHHGNPKGEITDGVSNPSALATNRFFLFVANSTASGSYVNAYRQHDLKLVRTFARSAAPITNLAVDDRNELYVATLTSVGVYSGTGRLLRTLGKGMTCAGALAFDQSDNLYVANYVSGAPNCKGDITIYQYGFTRLTGRITKGLAGPVAMTFENTQSLWVANNLNDTVSEYGESSRDPFRIISTGVKKPTGVAISILGELFVASAGSGEGWISVYKAGQMTPGRKITDGIDDPRAIELVGLAQ